MGVRVKAWKGAWWVFVNHHGKRMAKRIGEREAAFAVARKVQEAIARDSFQIDDPPAGESPAPAAETFRTYAAKWLASAPLKASTLRFYGDNLTNHLYPAVGDVALDAFRRSHVKDLLVLLRQKRLSAKTITGIVRTLSTILSEAVEDEKLVANPALRPGRLSRRMRDPNALKKERVDPYTRDDVRRMLDAARDHFPRWYVFLLAAVRTGMRLGELRALVLDTIDWHGRYLKVERNFVEGAFTVPKTHEIRQVDLSTQLRAELRLWRRRQRIRWWQVGRPLPALVFPSDVEAPIDDSQIRKAMVAIARKADVRVRPRPVHMLRHTFASLLIQQGESLVYVKEQLGHSSIQVTVDIYGHLIPGGNRQAVDRLDDDFDATPAQPGIANVVSRVGIEPTTRRLRAGIIRRNR